MIKANKVTKLKKKKRIKQTFLSRLINFCQAQTKLQLSLAEWLFFQLIQPPPTPTHPAKFISQQELGKQSSAEQIASAEASYPKATG